MIGPTGSRTHVLRRPRDLAVIPVKRRSRTGSGTGAFTEPCLRDASLLFRYFRPSWPRAAVARLQLPSPERVACRAAVVPQDQLGFPPAREQSEARARAAKLPNHRAARSLRVESRSATAERLVAAPRVPAEVSEQVGPRRPRAPRARVEVPEPAEPRVQAALHRISITSVSSSRASPQYNESPAARAASAVT